MKHITTWRPDTCDCEIQYEWDDTIENRVHNFKSISHECMFHTPETEKEKIFDTVMDENKRKNQLLSEVAKTVPEAYDTKDDGKGNLYSEIKPGKEVNWSFDEDRSLKVTLVGFTKQQKDAVKTKVEAEFARKVTLV